MSTSLLEPTTGSSFAAAPATVTSSQGSPTPSEQPSPSEAPVVPINAAPDAYISAADAPTWEQLAARFRPIFARIAEGAVAREQTRTLAYEPVAWLREAGFGYVRIPKAYGGLGATIPQFFRLLIELGEADSNVSHLFRGHFSFLEARLNIPEPASHARWFSLVAKGAVLGYAMAERTEHTGGSAKLLHEN